MKKKIGKNPKRMTKIEPFPDKYRWEGINYLHYLKEHYLHY